MKFRRCNQLPIWKRTFIGIWRQCVAYTNVSSGSLPAMQRDWKWFLSAHEVMQHPSTIVLFIHDDVLCGCCSLKGAKIHERKLNVSALLNTSRHVPEIKRIPYMRGRNKHKISLRWIVFLFSLIFSYCSQHSRINRGLSGYEIWTAHFGVRRMDFNHYTEAIPRLWFYLTHRIIFVLIHYCFACHIH